VVGAGDGTLVRISSQDPAAEAADAAQGQVVGGRAPELLGPAAFWKVQLVSEVNSSLVNSEETSSEIGRFI